MLDLHAACHANGCVTPPPASSAPPCPPTKPRGGTCGGATATSTRQLADDVTERTWKRILDPDSQIMCIVAEVEGQVYGFANCVVHENTWETQAVCYLEDLYVTPAARGHGIGSALLEWLRNAMRAEGWARLYWVTEGRQRTARGSLYDRSRTADGFVRYVIRQK